MNPGRILHTGALLALADGSLYMGALLRWAVDSDTTLAVPTGVLAQAWARAGFGRYRISALLGLDVVVAVPLSESAALAVGDLLAGTGNDDVAAAHSVHLALDQSWAVVTDDAAPIRGLHEHVVVDELP